MSTLVADPVVIAEEVETKPHFLTVDVEKAAQPKSAVQAKEEFHPMLVVFIACVIAFHLAAAMIGSVAAWIYQLRHSGAFAP